MKPHEEVLGVECALPAGFRPRTTRPRIRWTAQERREIRRAAWGRLCRVLVAATLLLTSWHVVRGVL